MILRILGLITLKPSTSSRVAERNAPLAQEIAQLEERLREDKAHTEALAKIRYAEWRLRKAQDQEHYLKYGVSLPLTTRQHQQDEFFTALERRLDDERRRYVEETKAIESRDSNAERMERERQATERVLTVLEEDLG